LRKSLGKEARLCFAGHALMDNRHGLISDVCLTPSVGVTESEAGPGAGGPGSGASGFDPRVSVATRAITQAGLSMPCSRSASLRMWPSMRLTSPPAWRGHTGVLPAIGPVRSCVNASSSSLVGAKNRRRSAQDAAARCQAQQAADVPDWLGLQLGTRQSNVPDHRIGVLRKFVPRRSEHAKA